jgi:hypothetical protein
MYAVPFVLVVYALIDAILTPSGFARTLPKWLWLLLIVVVPGLGAVAWLIAGRPLRVASDGDRGRVGVRGRGGGASAPDDDPAFLRKLADDAWSQRMRERREGGATTIEPQSPPAPPADGAPGVTEPTDD